MNCFATEKHFMPTLKKLLVSFFKKPKKLYSTTVLNTYFNVEIYIYILR